MLPSGSPWEEELGVPTGPLPLPLFSVLGTGCKQHTGSLLQPLRGRLNPGKGQQEGMRLAVVQLNRDGAQCFEARLSAATV